MRGSAEVRRLSGSIQRDIVADAYFAPNLELPLIHPSGIFSPRGAGRRKLPPSLLAHAAATHPQLESGLPVRRLLNPWPELVPLFDLEMAQALAKMIGLSALPVAPIHFDDKN